jgi:hypothetical protein
MHQDVGLAAEREAFSSALCGQFECESNGAFDSESRVDRLLGRHFMTGPAVGESPGSDVEAFCVLTHHDEVDVVVILAGEWRCHSRVEAHRPEVYVLVEFATQTQDDPPLQNPWRHLGVTYGSEQDCIDLGQGFQDFFG